MGLASLEESVELEKKAQQIPEIAVAIRENQVALEKYAELYAEKPKNETKEKLFERISFHTPTIEKKTPANSPYFWWAAASIFLFLFSSAINYTLYQNLEKKEVALIEANSKIQVLAANESVQKTSFDQLSKKYDIINNPGAQVVLLATTSNAIVATAKVIYNKASQKVYLTELNLPIAPEGKQYQFWGIVDGKPINGGLISSKSDQKDDYYEMNSFANVQTFAISLETMGGVQSPTMEAIIVIGNI